jgi:hypothetical protein
MMARQHMSITGRSDQVMTTRSTDDNVPSCIQSAMDTSTTSTKLVALTTA